MDYRTFRYIMNKRAAAVMTPEAEQAAMGGGQPPMDPAMAGGAPPMDPAMAGGMPPMDPSMQGGDPMMQATGPQGGQIPPEILQDQGFIEFLSQMAGIIFDPQSGMFMDPNGQPVPAEAILQAYQEYQAQMQQQGGQPPMDPAAMGGDPSMAGGQPPMDPSMMGGQPPMDPAAMGGDPAMMGGMPPDPSMMGGDPAAMGMDPSAMGGDPSMMGGQPPMDQGAEQPPAVPDEVMDQIVSAVMSGVETMLQQYTEKLEAKFSELSEKLDTMVDITAGTDDTRTKDDRDQISKLRQEMESDLTPVKEASVKSASKKQAKKLVNIFDIIQG